jgi:hypothetical protein
VVYLRGNSIEDLSAALRAHQIRFLCLGVLGETKRQMLEAEENRGLLRSQGIRVR